jgi:predicted permease
MLQDLRHAARLLLKNKGWTSVVVLSLALGIGANTALFSAINGLVLRKLSVPGADELVRFGYSGSTEMSTNRTEYGAMGTEAGLPLRTTFSQAIFQALRTSNQTLTDIFACAPLDSVNAVVDNEAEIASAFLASGNFHGVLGVRAILGRTITPGDDQPGASPVAVVSHGYWTRRFGSDPGVIGKVVRVNNVSVTIVGVMSRDFTGVQRVLDTAPDISLPLVLDPEISGDQRLSRPTYWWLEIMGRLKPGTTIEQVSGNLQGVFQQAAREGMVSHLASVSEDERRSIGNRTQIPQLHVSSGSRGVYDVRTRNLETVKNLTIVVALILLIVCANVANLLLSRSAGRAREVSIRLSIGATRWRVMRQLLTESVLLAAVGGTLGLLVASWGKELLPDPAGQAPLDARVLLFTAALTLFTGIIFGIAPAIRATGKNVSAGLKEGGRNLTSSRTRLGKSLVVVQIAVSLVLLIGAFLFLRTVQNLRQVNVGFNPQNLVLFRVNPRLNQYDEARTNALYARLIEQLRFIPGVKAASFSSAALLSGSDVDTDMVVQGRPYERGPQNFINELNVGPGFFETLEIPIASGRTFTSSDHENSPKVAVINEAAARKFFPNENPLGRRFGTDPETSSEFEVAGVIRDAKYSNIRTVAPPTVYFFHFQRASFLPGATFEIRTLNDPQEAMPAIREAVRKLDPNLPLLSMSTQMEQIEGRFSQERIFAQAYALFGSVALLLASLGLFGLLSYNVSRRTNEIGIRLALGARSTDVLRMIMRESLWMVSTGLAIGLVAALIAGRLVADLLFELAPSDPVTIGLAMAVMIAVSGMAGYLPARRASRVDPMVALRYE